MQSETIELPEKMAKLYYLFDFDIETSIDALYDVMFPIDKEAKPRYLKQQYLGPLITRLNRRIGLQKQKVVPGKTKGTYVLQNL